MSDTPKIDSEVADATADLLILLSFAVQPGTDLGPKSELGGALVRFKSAIEAACVDRLRKN